jgi:hypothetical protein
MRWAACILSGALGGGGEGLVCRMLMVRRGYVYAAGVDLIFDKIGHAEYGRW